MLHDEVAAGARLLHRAGVLTYSGHLSARLPGRDALLIHPRDTHRGQVHASGLLTCDFDGNPLDGSEREQLPLEVFIHTAIYRARPDVHCVVHTHSALAAAFTTSRGPLTLLKGHAHRWRAGVPTHPDPTHIKTPEQGTALANTLGDRHAALLRAHGGVIVAESVPAAVVDCIHFEENAQANLDSATLGDRLPLTPEELTALASTTNRSRHTRRLWNHYLADAGPGTNVALGTLSVPKATFVPSEGAGAAGGGSRTGGGRTAGGAA
ncbi:class II aldolase/adducin family protein [Pseudonocardia spinosispora]|uniref:class II aldolase/adducin family protein n=1 Tax=Pseudonocardia spinosispora TaxID=103441 RepID=UPI0003F8ED58|nr:class II aldolase/adducin family protein [Pseudonocardia spinosispora]